MNVHPTAIIDPGANVHPSCKIGPYRVIGQDVELGEGCHLVNQSNRIESLNELNRVG